MPLRTAVAAGAATRWPFAAVPDDRREAYDPAENAATLYQDLRGRPAQLARLEGTAWTTRVELAVHEVPIGDVLRFHEYAVFVALPPLDAGVYRVSVAHPDGRVFRAPLWALDELAMPAARARPAQG